MVQPGERRFTFRLYEDNPEDRELLRKRGTLLTDGKYRSKNEVLRRGIALVYETCYEVSGESRVSAGIAEHEIKEASRWIAEEVIRRIGEGVLLHMPELQRSDKPGVEAEVGVYGAQSQK